MLIKYFIFFILTLFSFLAFAENDVTLAAKREVSLELDTTEGATSYEIEIQSKFLSKPQFFKMKTPIWRAKIRPAKYTIRMRSYDSRNVPGPWGPPTPFVVKIQGTEQLAPVANEIIKTNLEDKFEVEFKFKKIPEINEYRVDIHPLTGGENISESLSSHSGKIELPVAAEYAWSVTPLAEDNREIEKTESERSFTLIGKALSKPEIVLPADIWVEKLEWDKVELATHYSYTLMIMNKNKAWEKIETQDKFTGLEIPFPLSYPGGRYKLLVKAHGHLREDSKVSKIEFNVYSGDRSPAAIEESKLRHSLEKPTSWYFIASYLATEVNYSGLHGADGNRKIEYNALGGTGRLGLGYSNKKSNTGYFGIIDLSGLTLANKNVTWASAEAHHVWHKTWGRNLFKPSLGLFYKELIETTDTGGNQQFKFDKISYMGPHFGFDFWQPLNAKLGWQVNARAYYGLLGLSSASGEKPETELSYQLGFMGSYKLKQNVMGFMGWARRLDHASYKSAPTSTPGSTGTQDVTISGDYINLLLEWGF